MKLGATLLGMLWPTLYCRSWAPWSRLMLTAIVGVGLVIALRLVS